MTAPKNATTRGGKRFYTWRNENYWSVTTILSALPKPALINWAKKFTAEYAVEHFDAFSTLVKDDPDGAVEWLKGAAFRDRDRKADLGSSVHAASEAYILGKPMPAWPLPIRPRMAAFEQFLADFEPVYEMSEASIYSKEQHYAGTLDGIVTIGDKKLVLDAKTGKAIYPEIALQLSAYRHADFVGLPDGSEEPMPETHGAVGLHLRDDGYDLIEVDTGPEVYKTFLFVREVFRWQEQLSKSVLLGPYPCTLESAMPLEEVV